VTTAIRSVLAGCNELSVRNSMNKTHHEKGTSAGLVGGKVGSWAANQLEQVER